jgi:pectin methylesterase-like acyl-CoA thioesterase
VNARPIRKWAFAVALVAVCAIALAVRGTALAAPNTLVVDDDKVQCPNADFTSIQAAVTAATPGTTIVVCPGTYTEQVTIPAGKNDLTLVS